MALIPGNLLSENNQDVETSVGGWASFSTVSSGVVQSGTQFFSGTKSVQSTANAGTAGALGGLVTTVDLPVVKAGTSYEYSYFVFSPKAAIFNANIDWYQANNTTFVSSTNSVGQAVPVNGWTKITGGGIAPALSGVARLYLQVTSGLANLDVVFFDQMFFGWPLAAEPDRLFQPGTDPVSIAPWYGAPDSDHSVIVQAGTASVTFLSPATRPFLLLALTSETGPGATVTTFNDSAPLDLLFQPNGDMTGGIVPWGGATGGPSSAVTVTAGVASVTFTGLTVTAGLGALPGTGSVTLTAQAPVSGLSVLPGTAAITLTAQAPLAGLGALSGAAPVTLAGLGATAGLGTLPGTASVTTSVPQETTGLGTFPGVAPVAFTALDAVTVSTEGTYDPSPVLFLPDDVLGGVQPWAGAPDSVTLVATTATAGVASLTFSALAPTMGISALPGQAALTIPGQGPTAGLATLPGAGTVTLTAQAPATGLGALPGTAQVTTSAPQDVTGLTSLPSAAPLAFASLPATVSTLEDPQALPLVLLTPDDVAGGILPWGGAPQGIVTGDTTVLAGVATLTVTAQSPSTALSIFPGTGTVSLTAQAPAAGLGALPGTGTVTLAGQNASSGLGALPGTGTITFSARTPAVGLTALPGTGTVVFTAQSPSAAFSGTATPGTATVTMTARSASSALVVVPSAATVAVSARTPAAGLGALPGTATVGLTSYDPTVTVPQAAHGREISGRETVTVTSGREYTALATGREGRTGITGREPVSSATGEEPDTTISGREG